MILATAVVVSLGGVVLAWGAWRLSKSRSYQLFGDLVTRVETTDSVVALTFDDGPVPRYTDSVLAILADSSAPATFFVVGSALAEHPDLARRVVQAGHELGNHSYSHHALVFKTPTYVRHEIQNTDTLIRAAGQRGAIHFRPPYGKRLVILPWLLSRAARTTVLWDLEPDSYPAIGRDPARIRGPCADERPSGIDHPIARGDPGACTGPRRPADADRGSSRPQLKRDPLDIQRRLT